MPYSVLFNTTLPSHLAKGFISQPEGVPLHAAVPQSKQALITEKVQSS